MEEQWLMGKRSCGFLLICLLGLKSHMTESRNTGDFKQEKLC